MLNVTLKKSFKTNYLHQKLCRIAVHMSQLLILGNGKFILASSIQLSKRETQELNAEITDPL